jgi:hypothetical protein
MSAAISKASTLFQPARVQLRGRELFNETGSDERMTFVRARPHPPSPLQPQYAGGLFDPPHAALPNLHCAQLLTWSFSASGTHGHDNAHPSDPGQHALDQ